MYLHTSPSSMLPLGDRVALPGGLRILCAPGARAHQGLSGARIFRAPVWVYRNIAKARGLGQAAAAAGAGASLATAGITAGIGAALDVGTAIAQYMLQSAAQRDDTTNLTNYAATMLGQNSQAYNSCQISASEAQQNFDQIWAWLVQQCSQPAMGTAGGSCIQERQAGGSIDWFKLYYDTYSNPPGPGNYVGAAGYPPTTAGCTMSAATAAASSSGAASSGCLSVLTPFGIPDPCIGPVGMFTAVGVGVLLLVILK